MLLKIHFALDEFPHSKYGVPKKNEHHINSAQ